MLNCNTVIALQKRLDDLMAGKEIQIGKNKYYIIGSTKKINGGKTYLIMKNDENKSIAFIYWYIEKNITNFLGNQHWSINSTDNINDIQ